MTLAKYFRPKTIALVTMSLLLGVLVYGFAASNTVPESGAGDGAGEISGYDVSDVSYALDSEDPTVIDTVSFNVAPEDESEVGEPNTVTIELIDASGDWYDCATTSESSPWLFVCDVEGDVTVADADQLRVIAVE